MAAGYENVAHLRTDSNLTSLHADWRWQPMLAKLTATVAKADAHVNVNQTLKQELAAMRLTDQRIRLRMDSVEKK